jgi:acetoin utilization protein AcuC
MAAYLVHGKELDEFKYPEGCPLNTSRAGKAVRMLDSMNLLTGDGKEVVEPRRAERAELGKFHTARYLDALQRGSKGEMDEECFDMGLGTPDCPFFPDMYNYPAWGAGASLVAAELILDGAPVVFNPSGGFHHAGAEQAGGFCYINDIVLASMLLADAGKKVMFIDIDVHHCDGVQDAFNDRDDIMTFSMHESGKTIFPGTGFVDDMGVGAGKGYSVNVPLPVGTYDEAYERVFKDLCSPLVGAFDPDVIVLEIGMDGLAGDPLAHLNLTNNSYASVISKVLDYGKPVLATGGGGYHVANTSRGWALAWTVLSGESGFDDALLGLGGVMMESSDWQGGLRDRALVSYGSQRDSADMELEQLTKAVKSKIFPLHGLW